MRSKVIIKGRLPDLDINKKSRTQIKILSIFRIDREDENFKEFSKIIKNSGFNIQAKK